MVPPSWRVLCVYMLWPCSNLVNLLQWRLERLENGRYKLYTRGAQTAELDRLLYASLTGVEKAEEWIITAQPQMGRSQYT
jgi:hypothetical protein